MTVHICQPLTNSPTLIRYAAFRSGMLVIYVADSTKSAPSPQAVVWVWLQLLLLAHRSTGAAKPSWLPCSLVMSSWRSMERTQWTCSMWRPRTRSKTPRLNCSCWWRGRVHYIAQLRSIDVSSCTVSKSVKMFSYLGVDLHFCHLVDSYPEPCSREYWQICHQVCLGIWTSDLFATGPTLLIARLAA